MNNDRPLSPYYNLDSILYSLTNSNNYDKDIEIFWYSFKESIKNFLKDKNDLKDIISDKLRSDSEYLNTLKDKEQYDSIMKIITARIEEYIYLIMKYKSDHYHTNILLTNTKRWHVILEQYNSKSFYLNKNYVTFITVYTKIVKKLSIHQHSDVLEYLNDMNIEYIDKLYNIEKLLDILIKYNISAAIDNIIDITDITKYIKDKYGIIIFNKTRANKILSQIKNIDTINID